MNSSPRNSAANTALQPVAPSPSAPPQAAPRRSRLPGRFARLPELAGRSFLPLGLFARLPLAMLTVGTLTLVTAVSHSYAIGGLAAGAVGIGSALGAPVLGSLADRSGQCPVLLVAAAVNAVMVIALLFAAYLTPDFNTPTDTAAVLLSAFLSGASCPQVGPMARVRWMALTTANAAGPGSVASSRADLDTALSYEGTADEVTFVLGPALVGILASLVAPWLPLALAAVLTATLVPAFAIHPSHLAVVPAKRKARTGVGSVHGGQTSGVRSGGWLKVAVPVLAMVCMGTFFGATQNALSAFSAQFATAEIAGLMYSVVGLSSAVAALSVAYWPQRFGLAIRWALAAAAMTAFSLLLFLPTGIWPMVIVLLVLGIPVGPVMVTVFSIGGVVAPAGRMATVMTALASGIVAGTAVGAYLAGQLAQTQGPGAAFAVSTAASGALLVLGIVAGLVLRRRPNPEQ
ncbi:MFS transporter [Arthrobacter bambusae]|uniref:MFS transporter n=1 Tax=Arthrobacter bambusae TaxID=1338426 RepID=UPI00278AFB46|nr:MFS transporter [Arthrobacter bambusae]MDQ0031892.1 MFS family permease [Arthrobacter bambusae]MDQ0100031.1 MFS family permease [Arthrobacter bambusae]